MTTYILYIPMRKLVPDFEIIFTNNKIFKNNVS